MILGCWPSLTSRSLPRKPRSPSCCRTRRSQSCSLCPAGDGGISREGSVALRRALIDLGIGLWRSDPAARRYGQRLRARGKKGGVIGCAMANCANRIAYALVRDQSGYQSSRQGFPDIAAMLTRLFASAAIELASIKAKLGGPL
jgi:hypothetical protein